MKTKLFIDTIEAKKEQPPRLNFVALLAFASFILILCVGTAAAEIGFSNPTNLPKLSPAQSDIISFSNSTGSVNNSQFLRGYTPDTLPLSSAFTSNVSSSFVPYNGASRNVNLATFNLTASNILLSAVENRVYLGDVNNWLRRDNSDGTTQIAGASGIKFRSLDTNNIMVMRADGNVSIDGSTFSVIAPNNRVGIGISNPSSTLEVNGTFRLAGSNNLVITNCQDVRSSTSADRLKLCDTGTELYANSKLNIVTSGNVGIGTGTATPSQKLDVRGNGNFSGTVYLNNGTDVLSLVSAVNITSNTWNISGSYLYPADLSRNIGIGTASPADKLTVVGGAVNSSLFEINSEWNTASATPSGGMVFSDTGGTWNDWVIAKNDTNLIYNVASTAAHNFTVGGTQKLLVNTNGVELPNVVLTGTTNLSGSAPTGIVFSDTGGTSNDVAIYRENITDRGIVYKVAGVNGVHYFNIGDNEVVRIANSGNVGIGTTSPDVKLEIFSGDEAIRIGNSTNVNTYIGIADNGGAARGFVGYGISNYGSDTGSLVVQGNNGKGISLNANSSTFDTGTDLYVAASGNVGIGITTPAHKLVVNGVINASAYITNGTIGFTGSGASCTITAITGGIITGATC